MKRFISLMLSFVLIVSAFSCLSVTAFAVKSSEFFTVKTSGYKGDKITYTVYLNEKKSFLGAIIFAEFDNRLLAIDTENSGPCMVENDEGDVYESIGGMYESGMMVDRNDRFSIGHTYGMTRDYNNGSSKKPYIQFVFEVVSDYQPETDVKFYCYELTSIGKPEKNIVNGSENLICSLSTIHTHVISDWIVEKKATCTSKGLKVKKCTDCYEVQQKKSIPATGHTESDWIIEKKATADAAGKKYKKCTVCKKKLETATIKQLRCSAPKIKDVANTTSGVKITWGKVSGADKYKIYRSKTKSGGYDYIGSTSKTYFTDKKAKSGTKYYYKVKAVNEVGDSSSSSADAVKYVAAPKLSKVENTSSGVKFTWGKVSGASGYYVYRKAKGGSWKQLTKTSKTYYTDKTAKSGTTYYYSVRAYSGSTKSAYDTTGLKIKHLADTTLKSATSGKSGVTLKWSKVTGTSGYYVYRATGSGSYKKLATVKGSTKVSYVDKTAKKGKTYKYKLKAYSGSTTSAYSNVKKVKDKY